MEKLVSFHGKKEIKKEYINRVKEHQRLDEIHKGQYFDDKNKKFCAVGCTIHSSDHKSYETELGIPKWLAYVEDSLFEGMSSKKSKTWPLDFLNAIKVGVDLEKVKAPLQIMVLENVLETLEGNKFNDEKFPDVIKSIKDSKEVVKTVLELWRTGKINDESAARRAESAAWSAESAAWSAARRAESAARRAERRAESAARRAESAARRAESAAWSAESAAWSAAWSAASAESAAWSAAWSAESAERSAWSAAWSAASAASAESAERSAAFDKLADGLLKIIKSID